VQIGVYLSHLEIWKKAAKSVDKVTFILEDDALIICDSPTLQKYMRHIPEDADIFFINHRKIEGNILIPISLNLLVASGDLLLIS